MKPSRYVLLIASATLVLCLLGGGLALKVVAAEGYGQAVLFGEIMLRVMENYVDPVETDRLLEGAFESMLSGLDPNSAYLTPSELEEWSAGADKAAADPGVSVLKTGRGLEVVAVAPGSSADDAGLKRGDVIRTLNGRSVRTFALEQARRLLRGEAGSSLTVELLRPEEGFSPEEIELVRAVRQGRAYGLDVRDGIAVLSVLDIARVNPDDLTAELDDVRSRGVDTLLLDLRNQTDAGPREIVAMAELFCSGELLRLRNRAGELVESLESSREEPVWSGEIAVLVNDATAGGAEALARVVQTGRDATVFGETTYGLGAEAELVELENGSALLISVAIWEGRSGEGWNGDGVEPDRQVLGTGSDYAAAAEDQLNSVLDLLGETLREAA